MRKKVILLGVVSVFGLFVFGVSLFFQKPTEPKDVITELFTHMNSGQTDESYSLLSTRMKELRSPDDWKKISEPLKSTYNLSSITFEAELANISLGTLYSEEQNPRSVKGTIQTSEGKKYQFDITIVTEKSIKVDQITSTEMR